MGGKRGDMLRQAELAALQGQVGRTKIDAEGNTVLELNEEVLEPIRLTPAAQKALEVSLAEQAKELDRRAAEQRVNIVNLLRQIDFLNSRGGQIPRIVLLKSRAVVQYVSGESDERPQIPS